MAKSLCRLPRCEAWKGKRIESFWILRFLIFLWMHLPAIYYFLFQNSQIQMQKSSNSRESQDCEKGRKTQQSPSVLERGGRRSWDSARAKGSCFCSVIKDAAASWGGPENCLLDGWHRWLKCENCKVRGERQPERWARSRRQLSLKEFLCSSKVFTHHTAGKENRSESRNPLPWNQFATPPFKTIKTGA